MPPKQAHSVFLASLEPASSNPNKGGNSKKRKRDYSRPEHKPKSPKIQSVFLTSLGGSSSTSDSDDGAPLRKRHKTGSYTVSQGKNFVPLTFRGPSCS